MATKARGQEDIFLVFVEGRDGRQEPYAAWFAGRHMADMRALPGVASAQAYQLTAPHGPPPAKLCAVYEFAAGAAVLDTISRVKGAAALPHSPDQGPMVWRLFETAAHWPDMALPTGTPMTIVLIEAPRGLEQTTALKAAAAALAAEGAAYVRALRLSPAQPSKGSEFGAALLVAGDAAAEDRLTAVLERCFGRLAWRRLLAAPL